MSRKNQLRQSKACRKSEPEAKLELNLVEIQDYPTAAYFVMLYTNIAFLLFLCVSWSYNFKYIEAYNFVIKCLSDQNEDCGIANFECVNINMRLVDNMVFNILYVIIIIMTLLSINLIIRMMFEIKVMSSMFKILQIYNTVNVLLFASLFVSWGVVLKYIEDILSLRDSGVLTFSDNYFDGTIAGVVMQGFALAIPFSNIFIIPAVKDHIFG